MMNPAQLEGADAKLSWDDYRRNIGAPTTGDVNVAHPEFFRAVNKMLPEVSVADWKTYLALASDHRGGVQSFVKV